MSGKTKPKSKKKKIIIPIVCVLGAAILVFVGLFIYGNIKMIAPTSVDDYIAGINESVKWGETWTTDGFAIQGEYYYSLAGLEASSLRFAIEQILYLRGEGESLDALTEGSRFTDWNTIAEINYSSPFPYYFEGLLYQFQGKTEEAAQAYNGALASPLFPDDGLDFYHLRNMEISELYELRDRLREMETAIYTAYSPVISGYMRDAMNGNAEYMVIQSALAVNEKDFPLAFTRARIAVQNDPFNPDSIVCAASAAITCGEYVQAARYIDNGLLLAPEDEGLNRLRELFIQMSETPVQEGSE
jgi:hypothetical protein